MLRFICMLGFISILISACAPVRKPFKITSGGATDVKKEAGSLEGQKRLLYLLNRGRLKIPGYGDQGRIFIGKGAPFQLVLSYTDPLPEEITPDRLKVRIGSREFCFKDTNGRKEYFTDSRRIMQEGIKSEIPSFFFMDKGKWTKFRPLDSDSLIIDTVPPKPTGLRVKEYGDDYFVLAWQHVEEGNDVTEYWAEGKKKQGGWVKLPPGSVLPSRNSIRVDSDPEEYNYVKIGAIDRARNIAHSGSVPLNPKGLGPVIQKLSQRIVDNRKIFEDITIAAFGFNVDGRRIKLADLVEEGLITARTLNGAFDVRHGMRMKETYLKWKRGKEGMIHPAWARDYGREANVQAVLTGSITTAGDILIVRAWLMDVGSGSNISSAEMSLPLSDIPADIRPEAPSHTTDALSFSHFNILYRSRDTGRLVAMEEHTEIYSGDRYKVIFQPDQDCYVYIFQVDSGGKVARLFPMQSFDGVEVNKFNPVKKGKTYTLPLVNKLFILDDTTGIEKFMFFAFDHRVEELERMKVISRWGETNIKKYAKSKGLAGIGEDKPINVQWEDGENFEVASKRLLGVTGQCSYVIELIHR